MLCKPNQKNSNLESLLLSYKGKVGTFYFTYPDNDQWNAKIFKGVIESACEDSFVISDTLTNKKYLLLYRYLNWADID